MRIKKLILSGILSMGLVFTNVAPSFAATTVNIETKATTVNVNVPGTMAIVFNENGTNTVPTNFSVANNSGIAGVSLVNVSVDAGTSGWNFVSSGTDMKTRAADTKDIKFTMGKTGTTKVIAPVGEKAVKASASFAPGQISIPASSSQLLAFSVERTAFKSAISASKAFDMTLTFQFN